MIEVILTIVAIVGIILQYHLEHVTAEETKKKKFGRALMAISIVSVLGAYISKSIDSKQLSTDITAFRSSNDTLKIKLDNLQSKTDSLLASNEILRALLEKPKQDVNILSAKTDEGLAQSPKSIETIEKASGAPIISQSDKNQMISILSARKGKIHFELSMNDGRVLQCAKQLKEIFRASGWQVTNKYDYFMYNPPLEGLQVVIKKSDKFPVGLEEVVRAIKVTGIKYELFYVPENDKRLADYIYVFVGHQ